MIVFRKATSKDIPFMQEMLYEAVYWRENPNKPSYEESLSTPEMIKVVSDWGNQNGDIAVIASEESVPVGAAWLRYWNADNFIRGYLDDKIPVLVIGVCSDYRHQGIGGKLIEWLVDYAAKNSIDKISLMVSKDNYALNLYKQQGFKEVSDTGDSLLMVRDIQRI